MTRWIQRLPHDPSSASWAECSSQLRRGRSAPRASVLTLFWDTEGKRSELNQKWMKIKCFVTEKYQAFGTHFWYHLQMSIFSKPPFLCLSLQCWSSSILLGGLRWNKVNPFIHNTVRRWHPSIPHRQKKQNKVLLLNYHNFNVHQFVTESCLFSFFLNKEINK